MLYYHVSIQSAILGIDKDVKQRELSFSTGGRVSWYKHFRKTVYKCSRQENVPQKVFMA